MPAVLDPTLEFIDELADESRWHIRRNIPIFKGHDRVKKDDKGKSFVAYTVTDDDLAVIAYGMNKNQKRGVPARMTVGHVIQRDAEGNQVPESKQPKVVGYWLNARVGTFGPESERCLLADAYVKPGCREEIKGRPYRSGEYYHGPRDLRGCGLFTSDPALDLGTVELYGVPKECEIYTMPGEFDMADAVIDTPEAKPDEFQAFSKLMERYAKETAPAKDPPPAKPTDAERMTRDDEAVNYARLSAEVADLRKEIKARDEVISTLTVDRDKEQCERMVRTLQAEGYQLKDDTPTLVGKLMKKSADDRAEMVQMIRDYSPKGAPTGPMIETYQGMVEDDPAKAKPAAPSRQQITEALKRSAGDPSGYQKELDALTNGKATKN